MSALLSGPRGAMYRAMWDRLTSAFEEEGLPYGELDMIYNSRLAQELAAWIETSPSEVIGNDVESAWGGHPIHDALFDAYFVRNVDISDIDALVDVAASAGVEPEAARAALLSRAGRERVEADWERSRDAFVTGVPTFAIDDRVFAVGAQPYDALAASLEKIGIPRRAEPT